MKHEDDHLHDYFMISMSPNGNLYECTECGDLAPSGLGTVVLGEGRAHSA